MAAFRLTLVRHGETRFNKEKILQGQGVDEPLSETGFRQAEAAGMYLRHVKFTDVFASDLLRAKQTTASILRNNLYCKEIPVKYDARLRERRYGVAEGKPLSALKAMSKTAGEQCPSFTPPGGETLDEVKARAKDFFEYVCNLVAQEAGLEKQDSPRAEGNDPGQANGSSAFLKSDHHCGPECDSNPEGAAGTLAANILVVSHGAYMRNWVGYILSELQHTLPATLTKTELSSVSPNTGISQFIIKLEKVGDNLQPTVHCVCLNSRDHLRDVSTESM